MILTALLGLALVGVIVSWEKQLPAAGESFSSLSAKRRAMSIAAIPVSVCLVGGFVLALVGVLGVENRGYGAVLLVFLLGGGAVGFSYLFLIAVSRVRRARKAATEKN